MAVLVVVAVEHLVQLTQPFRPQGKEGAVAAAQVVAEGLETGVAVAAVMQIHKEMEAL